MPYWQENEIRFDVSSSYLATVTGESVLERVEPVEDTKANSGEAGCLIMTNLRLLWFSNKTAKLNLTIGYNTLVTITSQSAKNKKLNSTDELYLLAKVGNGRFEFLFTPLLENKTNYSVILNEIHKSYVASKPFRELRLRHHIIHANQLKVMPLEHICNRVEGVWNLANNQFSLRDSKFGKVLVIESTENNGGRYLLGFRIDPASRLKQILQEIQSLHLTQIRNPELGVSWNSISTRQTDALGPVQDEKEDEGVRCFTNYLQTDYMDSVSCGHPPEFDRTIGLAMEKLPSGVNRNTLWQIIF